MWPRASATQRASSSWSASPNGTTQLTVNGHPVYTYKNDSRAGEATGQGSGGQWYVIGTDGQPITKKS